MKEEQEWYNNRWGNYKSDKYKSVRVLIAETYDLLACCRKKPEMIKIKEFIKDIIFERNKNLICPHCKKEQIAPPETFGCSCGYEKE